LYSCVFFTAAHCAHYRVRGAVKYYPRSDKGTAMFAILQQIQVQRSWTGTTPNELWLCQVAAISLNSFNHVVYLTDIITQTACVRSRSRLRSSSSQPREQPHTQLTSDNKRSHTLHQQCMELSATVASTVV